MPSPESSLNIIHASLSNEGKPISGKTNFPEAPGDPEEYGVIINKEKDYRLGTTVIYTLEGYHRGMKEYDWANVLSSPTWVTATRGSSGIDRIIGRDGAPSEIGIFWDKFNLPHVAALSGGQIHREYDATRQHTRITNLPDKVKGFILMMESDGGRLTNKTYFVGRDSTNAEEGFKHIKINHLRSGIKNRSGLSRDLNELKSWFRHSSALPFATEIAALSKDESKQ